MSEQQNEHKQTTEPNVLPAGLNTSRRKLAQAGARWSGGCARGGSIQKQHGAGWYQRW